MSKRNHPGLLLNNEIVSLTTINKDLVMILDSKLMYDENLKSVLSKISKTIGVITKILRYSPQKILKIHKSFSRPHLVYGNIIYCRTFNESFHEEVESIQYNAAIAITQVIRGTSPEKALSKIRLRIAKIQNVTQVLKCTRINHFFICVTFVYLQTE